MTVGFILSRQTLKSGCCVAPLTAIHHHAFTLISCSGLFICTVVASLKNCRHLNSILCRYPLTHAQLLTSQIGRPSGQATGCRHWA